MTSGRSASGQYSLRVDPQSLVSTRPSGHEKNCVSKVQPPWLLAQAIDTVRPLSMFQTMLAVAPPFRAWM